MRTNLELCDKACECDEAALVAALCEGEGDGDGSLSIDVEADCPAGAESTAAGATPP